MTLGRRGGPKTERLLHLGSRGSSRLGRGWDGTGRGRAGGWLGHRRLCRGGNRFGGGGIASREVGSGVGSDTGDWVSAGTGVAGSEGDGVTLDVVGSGVASTVGGDVGTTGAGVAGLMGAGVASGVVGEGVDSGVGGIVEVTGARVAGLAGEGVSSGAVVGSGVGGDVEATGARVGGLTGDGVVVSSGAVDAEVVSDAVEGAVDAALAPVEVGQTYL